MARKPETIEWNDMKERRFRASRLFKALSNPKAYDLCRLLLEQGAMEVAELSQALGRSQPAISRILRTLRDLNVVRYQKADGSTFYTAKHPRKLAALLDIAEAYITFADEALEPPASPGKRLRKKR